MEHVIDRMMVHEVAPDALHVIACCAKIDAKDLFRSIFVVRKERCREEMLACDGRLRRDGCVLFFRELFHDDNPF